MSEHGARQHDFITARELNMAVKFLSDKIDAGFKVTHEKQDHTNGRLRNAEGAIIELQADATAIKAVKDAADKMLARTEAWKIAVVSTFGVSALTGIGYLVKKALFG